MLGCKSRSIRTTNILSLVVLVVIATVTIIPPANVAVAQEQEQTVSSIEIPIQSDDFVGSTGTSSATTTNTNSSNLNPMTTNKMLLGYSFTKENLPYERKSPPLPIGGTINWERLGNILYEEGIGMGTSTSSTNSATSSSTSKSASVKFTPRHSHATTVFHCPYQDGIIHENNRTSSSNVDGETDRRSNSKQCLWLTGGRTDPYRTYELEIEDRTADVWYSENGGQWSKVMELSGDFINGVGNFNAKHNAEVAPWYSRYGHSLTSLDVDDDGIDDIMILMGGYDPIPSNDIWVSPNGTSWHFCGYAPWAERAYHSTSVFQKKLYIMGGTPLSNDVWSGTVRKDISKSCGYKIRWVMEVKNGDAPWAPRCAMCSVTQVRRELEVMSDGNGDSGNIDDEDDDNDGRYTPTMVEREYLYMIGGFAGWPREDERWDDGERTRNDVWRTTDGKNWERLLPPKPARTMPFVGRGWHACTTWHHPYDKARSVRRSFMIDGNGNTNAHTDTDEEEYAPPKIFLSGGGYMGTKGNNAVETLEGYVDMYWSYDGSLWHKVNYEEGSARMDNLYSTNDWASISSTSSGSAAGGKYTGIHRGKWGHTMESLPVAQDLNMDGMISNRSVPVEFCSGTSNEIRHCSTFAVNEMTVPSLFIIGGDTTDGGPMVNDVFISRPGGKLSERKYCMHLIRMIIRIDLTSTFTSLISQSML